MLRNADGGRGGGSFFPEKNITKVYDSILLALRGGGWGVQFPGKKRYVTIERRLMKLQHLGATLSGRGQH